MAIIYTYPEINQVEGEDLLLISDTSLHKRPTRSVTVNDLAAYIGTVVGVVQNLQSVLTVGNTYVSSDGYGTFTLNDITNNNGDIKYVNTDEGWGYALNAEEGLYFTDGAGSSTGFTSINRNRISIGNDNYIGEISSSSITANRTYALPNASGTLALTSDIPSPGPGGSGTTNYTARWTNASTLGIGTLYDNGNNVGIGTTNPVNKLHVHNGITRLDSGSASSNALGVYSNFSTTAINLFTGSTGSGFISVNNNGMNLGAPWNGGAKVSILNNGNVGIGTTSPGSTLPTDSETASKVLQLTGAGGSTGDTAVLLRSLDNSSGLDLWHNVSSGDSYIDNRYNSNQGDTIFRVKTAGTPLEALRITGNGNVGIGTTSPSQKLHVVGVGSFGTSTSQTLVDYDGLNAVGNTDYIRFKIDNSEKLRIKSNGNVGIGTTSPTKLLEVKSSSAYDSTVRLSTIAHNWDIQGGESGYSSTAFAIDYDGVTFFRAIGTTDSRFGSGLSVGSISTAPPTGGLYVAGNVGIGTTAPSSRLEIAGYNVASSISDVGANSLLTLDTTVNTGINLKAGITNNYNAYIQGYNSQSTSSRSLVLNPFGGNVGIGTTSPSHKLDVAGDIKLTNSNSIYWRNAANNADIPLLNLSSTNIFNVGTTSSSVPVQIALHTAGSERMRIDSSGNVGIGTTSPSSKLEIAGTGNQKLLVNRTDGDNFFIDAQNGQIRLRGSSNIYMGVGSDVLTVTNTNVGIGTTSPSSKFQVSVNDGDGITLKHGASNAFYILRDGSDDTIIKQTRNYTSKISISTLADSGTHESSGLNIVGQGVGLKSNVGIGTASPSEKLEVAGNIKVDKGTTNRTAYLSDDGLYISRSTIANSYPNSIIADPGNSNNLDINARSRISLKLNTNTVLIANDAGNVGIGTTGPGYPLEVNGIIKTSTSFLGTTAIIQKVTALNTNGIQFANNGGSEKMRITDAGNVGIGTNNPTTPLHVKADAPSIRLEDNTSGDNHYLTGNNGEFRVQSTGYITIRPGNTVSTRFDANGNVGIGTTSPLSKLNVNGDIKIEGENELYFGSSGSVPLWEIKASGSDLVINDTGSNVGSVLFNNDEGVVLPRLTTTEINAISLPNTGLTVYNTTLNTLCFYNGSSWQKVSHTNM